MNQDASPRLHLLCSIGSTEVAMPAALIEAVVKLDKVSPVPGAPPAIRGLAAIRSRMLTLIDCGFLVEEANACPAFMAIITVDGYGYGLLLDTINDVVEMAEPQPMPAKVSAAWRALEPLIGDHDGELRLVVAPERFIALASQSFASVA